jgi:hypothetical protein
MQMGKLGHALSDIGLSFSSSEKGADGTIRLMTASWNMGNAAAEGLQELIPNKGGDFDIIVLGLQESTYTTNSIMTSCVTELQDSIIAILGVDWMRLKAAKRAQMQVLIYVTKAIRGRVSRIQTAVENTGVCHVLPNKGGILTTMYVDGTSLAFISTHLAAHEGVKKCGTRNESTTEILGGVRAGDMSMDPSVQFHHTFWMGDMNYRVTFDPSVPDRAFTDTQIEATDKMIDEPEADDEYEDSEERRDQIAKIYDMIETENWEKLLSYDELNREVAAGRILTGFTPLQPRFPPTFKRKRHQIIQKKEIRQTFGLTKKDYDIFAPKGDPKIDESQALTTTYYDMKRLPSFTDRILHCSLPGFKKHLNVESFTSCEGCTSSDHKPVKAVFSIDTVKDMNDLKMMPSSRKGVNFSLFNLKGRNLAEMDTQAFGGGSDPYITITADPPEILNNEHSHLKSSTINHNLNPDWEEQMELFFVSPDVSGLAARSHLLISVWDADLVSSDDLIGTIALSVDDIVEGCKGRDGKYEETYEFHGNLVANGLVQGQLYGSINMSIPIYDEKLVIAYSMTSSTSCGCIVA